MIRTVVVPLDGSHATEFILPFAAAAARPFGARLHLFHVLECGGDQGVDAVEWAFRRSRAAAYLASQADKLQEDGMEATWELGEGRAATEILKLEMRVEADLVVLGTHGRGGPTEFAMGSTSLQYLSRAPGSVLLVPTAGEQRHRLVGATGLRRMLVPLDGSRRSEWAVSLARQLAGPGGASLLLTHVAPVPELPHPDFPLAPDELELQRRITERNVRTIRTRVETLREEFAQPDLTVSGRVEEHLQPPVRLLEIIEEEEPDLVVVSAHGTGVNGTTAREPFGHVARFLLANPSRPTLSLQDCTSSRPKYLRVGTDHSVLPERASGDSSVHAR